MKNQNPAHMLSSIKNINYKIEGNMINITSFDTRYKCDTYSDESCHIKDLNNGVVNVKKMSMSWV